MSPSPHDLQRLTGVRSSKPSYYREYIRSDERMQRAVRAMDSISHALVRTLEGPRGLLEEVARAAAAHLEAAWTLLALADHELPGARPRFVAVDPGGHVVTDEDELPAQARRELGVVRSGLAEPGIRDDGWVRVPMTLEGSQVGMLSGLHGLEAAPESDDLSVLRILANQAAVSLHTCEQYQAGVALHRRAQQLYDEATRQAAVLQARTTELRDAEHRLLMADQRELVDNERHRIARELHDNVTQYVLSAGMAVEVARGEVEAWGGSAAGVAENLESAKSFTAEAVDQLRRAIYALHRPQSETVATLPELLAEVVAQHRPSFDAQLRVEGEPASLDVDVEHDIARVVGEAMFNVAIHAEATRAVVRVRYRADQLLISVSDDGVGEPADLSRRLRLERATVADGRHRGLANMAERVRELGGTIAFRRARMGGVRVEVRIPFPVPPRKHGRMIEGLAGAAPATSRREDR